MGSQLFVSISKCNESFVLLTQLADVREMERVRLRNARDFASKLRASEKLKEEASERVFEVEQEMQVIKNRNSATIEELEAEKGMQNDSWKLKTCAIGSSGKLER